MFREKMKVNKNATIKESEKSRLYGGNPYSLKEE
jgi:hypothetical protein